jgi:hypothetical protein
MIEIINKVSQFIEAWANDYENSPDTSPDLIVKNWGFVELSKRGSRGKNKDSRLAVTEQPIPMTINGTGERLQVSLDDTKNFIFWIRIVNRPQFNPNVEDEWGLKRSRRQILPLRIVIAHKVELGENLVYELVGDLPSNIVVPGFEYSFLEGGEVDVDHETIHDTELGKTNYEKHRFDWNIYVINLNVEFIPCVDYQVPEFITDVYGNCIFA